MLDGDDLLLGSDPLRADVVVRDIEVEHRHAEVYLERGSGGYALRDLGFGEGAAVNGKALRDECRLLEGDRILLGDSVLEFSRDPVKASFHEALHRLINQGYLTGLLDKNRFAEEFEHRLETTAALGKSLNVLMPDIDNLKKINDQHGHLLSEYVVGEVSRTIEKLHAEGGRQATRFGGDEYQILLPNLGKMERSRWQKRSGAGSRSTPLSTRALSPTLLSPSASPPTPRTARRATTSPTPPTRPSTGPSAPGATP